MSRQRKKQQEPVNENQNVKVLPEWNDIKDKLGSISAMTRDLGMEPLTYGDAFAIFKTDNHRKLFDRWIEHQLSKTTGVNEMVNVVESGGGTEN